MNLNLSGWDWLNAALGVLFLYRGIRDLYNGTGTGWSTEDEKKHFRKFYGIASILCGALYLVNTFLPRAAHNTSAATIKMECSGSTLGRKVLTR